MTFGTRIPYVALCIAPLNLLEGEPKLKFIAKKKNTFVSSKGICQLLPGKNTKQKQPSRACVNHVC